MFTAGHVHVRAPGKALISWENHEIKKRTHRLKQFDICEKHFMNEYGNTNSFIIIFGSHGGHYSGRGVCGESSSVSKHRIVYLET